MVPPLEDEILSFDVPAFAEAEPESCPQVGSGGGRGGNPADSKDLLRLLLRLHRERRKKQAQSENDREPDPPHGHFAGDG